jgi:hypothetical protein
MTNENEDLIKFLSPIAGNASSEQSTSSSSARGGHLLASATPIKPSNLSSNLIDFASPQSQSDPFNETAVRNVAPNTEIFSQTYTTDCFSPNLNTDNKTIVVNNNNNNNNSNFSNDNSNENDASNLDAIDIIETSDLLNLTTELEENWYDFS